MAVLSQDVFHSEHLKSARSCRFGTVFGTAGLTLMSGAETTGLRHDRFWLSGMLFALRLIASLSCSRRRILS